jgi:hypothetical protein
MPPATASTIVGLVDAGGSSGASLGRSDEWTLSFHLAGWRHAGSAVVFGNRRCELAVSRDDMRSLMDRVKPYSILEAEIDGSSTAAVLTLRRIVHVGTGDPELEQLARQLQQPIVVHDATLGRLEYDRKYGWFAGRAEWCGRAVGVRVCCGPDDRADALAAAARLFSEQAQWQRRVREYAVEQLLPLKNRSWLDEDEEEKSADEFLAKMSIESISIDESGDVTFWHDDGGLFLGHAISISGTLSEGLANASIAG